MHSPPWCDRHVPVASILTWPGCRVPPSLCTLPRTSVHATASCPTCQRLRPGVAGAAMIRRSGGLAGLDQHVDVGAVVSGRPIVEAVDQTEGGAHRVEQS